MPFGLNGELDLVAFAFKMSRHNRDVKQGARPLNARGHFVVAGEIQLGIGDALFL